MWSLKFTVKNIDSIYTLISAKYPEVTDYLYPVDHYKKENKVFIVGMHVLEGPAEEQKKFAATLKKHKKTKEFEENGPQLITLIAEEEPFYTQLFAAELYHPAPVVVQSGYERWHVASWNRKILEKLLATLERWKDKFPELKLHALEKTNLSDIYFPKVFPELPEKQKEAFARALKRGYYRWPREADLQKLAKETGVALSTFQEHLRKAEARLLPFFADAIARSI